MKKILFVIPHLGCGGAEKELVTLLSMMDQTKWQIDLFLFEDTGMFRRFVPDYVRILPRDTLISIWNQPIVSSVLSLLMVRRWRLCIKRIFFGKELRKTKPQEGRSRLVWYYYRQILPRISTQYDVAIGYMEGMPNYYVNEMVIANRKIASMHNDYEKLSHLNRDLDSLCFDKMDSIVTDSEGCRDVLVRTFPKLKEKVHAIECFISPSLIRTMSMEQEDPFADNFSGIRILTVARLTKQKGIDIAVKACKILKDMGYSVRWYIIGDGEERVSLINQIDSLSLQEDFVLVGSCDNHYPSLVACDIYVQPSRWEGWGIAIEEAKILAKPVVLTRFLVAESRVEHMATGMVVDIQDKALALGLAQLIDDPQMRAGFCQNLRLQELGSDKELKRFYHLLNGKPV